MARRDVNNLWPERAAVPAWPGAVEPHPGTPGCVDMSDSPRSGRAAENTGVFTGRSTVPC